eukprot:scaffold823_cov86-Cylindrotheca_fusiformis.AAC.3
MLSLRSPLWETIPTFKAVPCSDHKTISTQFADGRMRKSSIQDWKLRKQGHASGIFSLRSKKPSSKTHQAAWRQWQKLESHVFPSF